MTRRIVIIGGPQVGKSTLAEKLKAQCGISNVHTSHDLEHLDWSAGSEFASQWFSEDGDWIVEGVQMARALRKWLKANPDKPLDVDILRLNRPFEALLDGQVAMTKGVETVFGEIESELVKRGARIHQLNEPDEAFSLFQQSKPGGAGHEISGGDLKKMTLKKELTKAEWEALSEEKRKFYTDEQIYVPDGDNWKLGEVEGVEDVTGLKASQQKLLDEVKALREAAKAFKDVDPEKYRQMLADIQDRERDRQKKNGDWEGWKESFETQKAKDIQALRDEISTKDSRIRKFLLEDKVRAAAIAAGVRSESIDRVVRDVLHPDRPRFRLDEKESIEVLSDSGSPMDLKIDSFFKDIYLQEAQEFYAAPGASANGGSGASGGINGQPRGVDLSKLSPTERLKVANRAG